MVRYIYGTLLNSKSIGCYPGCDFPFEWDSFCAKYLAVTMPGLGYGVPFSGQDGTAVINFSARPSGRDSSLHKRRPGGNTDWGAGRNLESSRPQAPSQLCPTRAQRFVI
jgi:hypothetical protein